MNAHTNTPEQLRALAADYRLFADNGWEEIEATYDLALSKVPSLSADLAIGKSLLANRFVEKLLAMVTATVELERQFRGISEEADKAEKLEAAAQPVETPLEASKAEQLIQDFLTAIIEKGGPLEDRVREQTVESKADALEFPQRKPIAGVTRATSLNLNGGIYELNWNGDKLVHTITPWEFSRTPRTLAAPPVAFNSLANVYIDDDDEDGPDPDCYYVIQSVEGAAYTWDVCRYDIASNSWLWVVVVLAGTARTLRGCDLHPILANAAESELREGGGVTCAGRGLIDADEAKTIGYGMHAAKRRMAAIKAGA